MPEHAPSRAFLLAFVMGVALWSADLIAQGPRQEARHAAVRGVQSLIHSNGDDALRQFAAEHLSDGYRNAMSEDELLAGLREIRGAASGADGLDLEMSPAGLRIRLEGPRPATILVQFDSDPPYKIDGLSLEDEEVSGGAGERDAIETRVRAVEGLGRGGGDEALRKFAGEHLAPGYRESVPEAELLDLLRAVRLASAGAGGVQVQAAPEGIEIEFRGSESARVTFSVEPDPPHRIVSLKIEDLAAAERSGPPLTWGNLEDRLLQAEREGFSGAVLVVRDGNTVLDRGYGLADRERGIPNSTTILFGIGSVPIDFTKAAILKLEETGKLSTSDPITRHVRGVPPDKRKITIGHLMQGTSGLPNFHHIPGVDEDYDLSWIDRDTALERILGQELMFAPGEGESHSHSAWGLLAAIVEYVSGQSYAEFLKQRLFEPAGMQRTGFYGKDPRFEDADYAVGYGMSTIAPRNSPNHWGPTSWLVMGSGGMFSTPRDLHRWVTAIRAGGLLSDEAQKKFWTGSPLAGGSDRGFLCIYTEGPDTMMFFSSNSLGDDHGPTREIGRALAGLVLED